jgi:hypothetical protein
MELEVIALSDFRYCEILLTNLNQVLFALLRDLNQLQKPCNLKAINKYKQILKIINKFNPTQKTINKLMIY